MHSTLPETPSTTPDRAPSSGRSRFVTLCQQLLVLAVVGAVLVPAARTITMDVRPPSDGADADGTFSDGALLRSAEKPSVVSTEVVDPKVREVSLTAPAGARIAPGMLRASTQRVVGGGQRVTSDRIPVRGYGAVGVTWAHGAEVPDDEIAVEVRYREDGAWSGWEHVDYHDDHGPDPDSEEARNARPGTSPVLVGDVDDVQVRIETDAAPPADLQLAVIDPGEDVHTAREVPEIDTGDMNDDGITDPVAAPPAAPSAEEDLDGDGDLDLAADQVAPRPQIFSRAQWGADERMRDAGSLRYDEVHAGFVHHTVSANDYTRDQVPAIIRGIYAYHTRSQGWSDVGYNFLVDRFGRIWEGRYGGVARPVVGAHTLGYNDDAFAMSAIGNYETARPSAAMIAAYGRLFAWKLGLHGIRANAPKTYVTSRYFKAINGHRDAGSTACPGRYLYERLGDIRSAALDEQGSWDGRQLESDLVGSPEPDLIVRRKSDGMAFILPLRKTQNGYARGKPVNTGLDLSEYGRFFKAGDWDRDGKGDLVAIKAGTAYLLRGNGKGRFTSPQEIGRGFDQVPLLAAGGDLTGDGWPDLVGQPRGGTLRIYPGKGLQGMRPSFYAADRVSAGRLVPTGRWNIDGAPDMFTRSGGTLTLRPGNGPGGFMAGRSVSLDLTGFDWTIGISDIGLRGHADLVVRSHADGRLWLLPGTLSGFGERVLLGKADKYDMGA